MFTTHDTPTPLDVRRMSHRNDPQTSKDAAAAQDLGKNARVKRALLVLLAEQPGAPFEVQGVYMVLRASKGWPLVQPHSVNRRLSELKKDGLIRGTGVTVRTPDGATAERLEVVPEAVAA